MGCMSLHAWYMRETNEAMTNRPTGITINYTENHFLHKLGYFVVGFQDLFELFNLDALEGFLPQCWTL